MDIEEAISILSLMECDLDAIQYEQGFDYDTNKKLEAIRFALEILREKERKNDI